MTKSGFLVIDKPSEITSFGVVAKLRKITGVRKIGHSGTLDPFATGVLVCAVGRDATRKIASLLKSEKEYLAKIKLGAISNTYDRDGKIENFIFDKKPTEEEIRKNLKNFLGKIKQVPPIFSAKKIGGRRAYDLARKGKEVNLPPSDVEIKKIKIISYKWSYLELALSVSSGTYIRSLAHDLGILLGTGAYLEELRRTKVGNLGIDKAISLDNLKEEDWQDHIILID